MTKTQYTLAFVCQEPHGEFDRIIPFNWKPTSDDLHHCIQRLRDQAAKQGVDLVQLKTIILRTVATGETNNLNITREDGMTSFKFTTETETKVL